MMAEMAFGIAIALVAFTCGFLGGGIAARMRGVARYDQGYNRGRIDGYSAAYKDMIATQDASAAKLREVVDDKA